MSSSKGVVKGKSDATFEAFTPPVQNLFRPSQSLKRKEEEKKQQEVKKQKKGSFYKQKEKEPAQEKKWTPPTVEELSMMEGSKIIENAKQEATQMMIQARNTAEQLLEEAKEEIENLKKEAFSSGYEDGYKDGYHKAVEEQEKALLEMQESFQQDMKIALSSIADAKEKSLHTYLDELKECAIAIAEKVIHISLTSSGDIIKRMIISETEKLKETAWVKVYMEKTDYEMMMQADADVVNELSRLSNNIKFVVMNQDKRGSCIIETPEEIIDISVETQLENIKEILGTTK